MTQGSRGGRPTKEQVAEREAQAARRAALLNVESKRAKPIMFDQQVTLWVWLGGLAIGFLIAAMFSYNGITDVAALIGLGAPWLQGLYFGTVELMYLLFLAAYLFKESRGEDGRGPLIGTFYFGGVALLANAYHTFKFHDWAWSSADMWAGVVLSVTPTIAVIAASKMAASVVFARRYE